MLLISQNKRHAIDSSRICSIHVRDDDANAVIIVHTEKSKYLFGTYPDSESATDQLINLAAVWNKVPAFRFRERGR